VADEQEPFDWDEWIRAGEDLGGTHYFKRTYKLSTGRIIGYPAGEKPADPKAIFIGIHESHREGDIWCGGWVGFKNVQGSHPESKHELVQVEPLTIAPSLRCGRCPSHGFIRTGRWVPA